LAAFPESRMQSKSEQGRIHAERIHACWSRSLKRVVDIPGKECRYDVRKTDRS
jgi:hypothetical protein